MAAAGNGNSGRGPNNRPPLIRNDLVNSAVRFLKLPQILVSSNDIKRKFLLNKGLTEQEIDLAFKRVGREIQIICDFEILLLPPHQVCNWKCTLVDIGEGFYSLDQENTTPHTAVNLPDNVQLYQPQLSPRHWVWNVVHNILAVGGLFYTVYWVWKNYIYPYLFGTPKTKSIEAIITELDHKVESRLSDFKTEIQTMHNTLDTLTGQRTTEVNRSLVSIQDVKNEVISLKCLLLNRSQFPTNLATLPAPPSIPSWQLNRDSEQSEAGIKVEDDAVDSDTKVTTDNNSMEMMKE